MLARQPRPVRVEAPAHADRRERQQRRERVAVQRRHRPDLDERRLARDAAPAPARQRATPRASGGGAPAPRSAARSARRGTGTRRGTRAAATTSSSSSSTQSNAVELARRRAGAFRFSNLPPAPGARSRTTSSQRDRRSSRDGARVGRAVARPARPTAPARGGAAPRAAHATRARAPARRHVERQVGERAQRVAPTADRPALAREEVGARVAADAVAAAVERRAQPPPAVRRHHRAVRAAPPRGVPDAAGEHAQLAARATARGAPARRSRAPRGRAGPRRASARAASRRARARRWSSAAARDVADAPAGGEQALLPLLLVAAPAAPVRVEARRRARTRCGGSPCSPPTRVARRGRAAPRSVCVIGGPSRPQVRRRAARPSKRARIGPVKTSTSGFAPRRVEQRLEPARRATSTSSSTNASSSPRGGVDAGVAGRVEAARLAERDVARARAGGQPGVGGEAAVVDDDHLRARRARPAARPRRARPRGSAGAPGSG